MGGTFVGIAEEFGLSLDDAKDKRQAVIQHFRVKNLTMWNKIMEGEPLAFTNVRHPFERLVSAYLDCGPGGKLRALKGVSFEDFVTNTVLREAQASKDLMFSNMHLDWRPYYSHCNFCNVPFKVISKTETFDEDRRRILEMVGLEGEEEGVRLHIHSGYQIHQITRKFFRNISQNVKTELLNLYKYEFAMFSYDTNLY